MQNGSGGSPVARFPGPAVRPVRPFPASDKRDRIVYCRRKRKVFIRVMKDDFF